MPSIHRVQLRSSEVRASSKESQQLRGLSELPLVRMRPTRLDNDHDNRISSSNPGSREHFRLGLTEEVGSFVWFAIRISQ
ncbi:hypothetical protein CAJAP_02741 [Camponotus japonicus]